MKVKKVLSLALALVMVFSMIPIQLITSAGVEKNKIGDATDLYVDVSIADESTGKYAGLIDVALQATIDYSKLEEGDERVLKTFNQVITIDPDVVSTVSKASRTRGNPNMAAMLALVDEASLKFINASKDWALIPAEIPLDDTGEETATFAMNSMSTLSKNTAGKVIIQMAGNSEDGYEYWEQEAPATGPVTVTLSHLYLKPQEGKTLADCKAAINLGTDSDIGPGSGTPSVVDALSYVSSAKEAAGYPNSVDIGFSSDFDPVSSYTVTFTGIKKADGTAADDVEITNDGVDEFEVPTLVNYTDGNFTYTANGWDKEVVNPATADATYTAQYTKTKNDASSLQTEVTSDEALKEEDYQSGWDTFAQKLAAAQTVLTNNASENPADWPTAGEIETALNDLVDARRALVPVAATYNITFVWQTAEGEQSTTVPFTEGAQIVAPEGSQADIDADTYTQAFQGWKDSTGEVVDLPTCSGEATFTAKYADPVAKTIAISFNYRDANAELTTLDVPAAELGTSVANYAPNAQTVTTADGNTTYEFTGWDPALGTVSAGVTEYTAQYNEVANKADYTAVDNAISAANEMTGQTDYAKKYTGDSRQVLTDAINRVVRDLPVSRQGDVDAMATAITDAITALTLQDYTITYVVPNSDPTTETFQYGATAQAVAAKAPVVPESYDDGDYHYTLTGWSPDFAAVDGNATYDAQYEGSFVPADTTALQTAVNNKIAERDSGTEWTDESVAALNQKLGEAEQYLNPPAQIGQSQQGAIDALTNAIKNSTLVPKGQPVTTYTIVFQDWDGSEISTQTVNAGNSITVPQDPTRPDSQDGNTSYTFTGWGAEVETTPTQDATYTAQYSETTNYADLTTLNDAISAAEQKQQEANFDEKYANAEDFNRLVSEANALAQSEPLKSQQGDVDAKAGELNNFELVPNQFTITFITHEGTTERILDYGETPQAPATPNYTENDYEYSFLEWKVDNVPAEIAPATANVTYVADYSSQFLPADYSANETAVGNAERILTTPDADKIYTEETLGALQNAVDNNVQPGLGESQQQQVDDATAAINDAITGLEKIVYTVTFNVDGQEYATGTYNYNVDLVVPVDPVKQEDNTYTYAFAGWEPQVSEKVTANATYNGSFTPTYKEYTVAFVDYDSTPISSETYHWGDTIQVPVDPTRPNDETYHYDFAGWDPAVEATCQGNVTYKATYTPTYIEYDIAFVDYNDEPISSGTYHWGDTITVPDDPTRPDDETYTYSFAGWNPAVVATCQGDETYKATYTPTYIDYTVKFTVDGADYDVQTLHYGDTVVLPDNPTKAPSVSTVYSFTGWTPEVVTTCQGDAEYTAVFNESPRMYTITVVTKDPTDASTVTDTMDVTFGDTPTIADPATGFVVAGTQYDFTGWDPAIAPVDGDATYTAQYTETPVVTPTYTINFKYADDATQAESGSYADHSAVYAQGAMPSIPTPDDFTTATMQYKFKQWDKEVGVAEADTTYTAVYDEIPLTTTYTINFIYAESAAEVEDGHLTDHFQTVEDGAMPTVPSPDDYVDGNTTYTFVGWDKEVVAATGDAVYTAIYQVDTKFVPDMTDIEKLVERYKQMVKTGKYVQEDLDAIKAYIDDIYDKYDNNEFTNQAEVDEMASYLKYLEDNARKIKEEGGNTDKKDSSRRSSYSRTARTGDNATLVVMSIILVSSIGLAVVTLKKRRKENF